MNNGDKSYDEINQDYDELTDLKKRSEPFVTALLKKHKEDSVNMIPIEGRYVTISPYGEYAKFINILNKICSHRTAGSADGMYLFGYKILFNDSLPDDGWCFGHDQ